MRIFRNFYETASELERELWEMGVEVPLKRMQDKNIENDPNYLTKELFGYSFRIMNLDDKDEILKFYDRNKNWANADFEERVQKGINPGEAWKLRDNVWDEFIHNGKFSYTYSERIGEQIDEIVDRIKKDPNTRQAIMSVWDKHLDIPMVGKERVPCSIFYQFIRRKDKLNMVYVMRSADLLEHFPYDLYLSAKLLEHIAKKLNYKAGELIVFVTSLHCYKKDGEKRNIF